MSLSIILATVLSCDYKQSDLFSLKAFAEEPDGYSSESGALSGGACIQSSDIIASAGETISVPFVMENNPGIMGFSIVVEYDKDVFTPLCVNAGGILNGGVIDNSIGGAFSEGKFKVTFSADENFYENGTVFTVDFAVNENAESAVYSLAISYLQRDTFNENFEDVTLLCSDFNIIIASKTEPDDGRLSFYSETRSVNAGEEIAVPIYAENANGLTDFRLSFSYNNTMLQFKEVKSNYTVKVADNGNGVLTVECNKLSVNTDNCKFFDVVFKTAEYAESEEKISISCGYAFVNGDSVDSDCVDSVLTIKNPYADKPSVIYTENRISNNNGYLEIPVYINNNHGIMGFGMNVSYDKDVLEAVSVTKGSVISKGNFNNDVGSVQGNIKVIWNHMEDIRDNGLLFTLRFRILDENNLISVPVTFSYSQADTYNEAWEDVPLNIDIGTILLKLVYTAQFIAEGAVLSTQEFTVDTEKLVEPSIPPRKGYVTYWENYELKEENLVINAKYVIPSVTLVSEYVMKIDDVSKLLPSCNFKPLRKEWSASNGSVATVDNCGNVTAVGEGKCTVKVVCYAVDSCGNEVKATARTKIIVEEKTESDNIKEMFRKEFYEFFEVTLHNILENIRMIFLNIFKIYPYLADQMELTFDPNGGTVSETQLTVYSKRAAGELPVPVRNGYTFVGWFTEADGGTQVTSETVFSTAADVTLYARWSLNTYTVNFNANGGSVDLMSKTVNAFDVYGALPVPQREGYNFKGWYTEVSGGTKVDSETVFESNGDVTLYARWSLIYFTVNYDPNGGTVPQSTKIVYYGRSIGGLPTPSRIFYTFDGWYTEADGGTEVTPSTSFNRVEDITLYAHWTMNNITVYFDANGGTAETESKTVGSDSTYGDLPVPTRKGYDFLGWYTDATEGEEVTTDTATNTAEDVVLYAHWSLSSFNVIFDANGGECKVQSVKAYYGTPIGTLPNTARRYYSFLGWHTAPIGGQKITPETAFMITEDITVYAHWKINTYMLFFDANGGTVNQSHKIVEINGLYGSMPTPQREGFYFSGWYTDPTGGTRVDSTTVYSTENNTKVYAHWTPCSYTVSWSSCTGCTIKVFRISSPYADAPVVSALYSGDTVYYGDKLSVIYKADTGYSVNTTGLKDITVSGNVTSGTIFATASPNSYSYSVVYKSSNGANLGSATVTKVFGTTNVISAPQKNGYTTPSAQTVIWDATEKTIEFVYVPKSVAYSTGSGTLDATPTMTYSYTIEYRNRTETSVEVRLVFHQTLKAYGYTPYKYYADIYHYSSSKRALVVSSGSWSSSVNYDRTCTGTTDWLLFEGITATSQSVFIGIYQWQANYYDQSMGSALQTEFNANIPTY